MTEQVITENEELNDLDFGEIHVSLKQPDQVYTPGRYRLGFQDYTPKKADTGNIGVGAVFVFDKDRHPEMGNRKMFENFWFGASSIYRYNNFLVCIGCNPELMREEPTGQMDEDGKPITKCAYGVKEQLDSVRGGFVWADVDTEEYTAKDVDGITDIKRKRSKIVKFVKA